MANSWPIDGCVGCGQPLDGHCLGFGRCNHKCKNRRGTARDAALNREREPQEASVVERLANGFLMMNLAYELDEYP